MWNEIILENNIPYCLLIRNILRNFFESRGFASVSLINIYCKIMQVVITISSNIFLVSLLLTNQIILHEKNTFFKLSHFKQSPRENFGNLFSTNFNLFSCSLMIDKWTLVAPWSPLLKCTFQLYIKVIRICADFLLIRCTKQTWKPNQTISSMDKTLNVLNPPKTTSKTYRTLWKLRPSLNVALSSCRKQLIGSKDAA